MIEDVKTRCGGSWLKTIVQVIQPYPSQPAAVPRTIVNYQIGGRVSGEPDRVDSRQSRIEESHKMRSEKRNEGIGSLTLDALSMFRAVGWDEQGIGV